MPGITPLARHLEAEVVLEEVDVRVDVGHHELLIDQAVAFEQVGDRRVVVDHELVDFGEPVFVALAEPLVFHAPAPVGVACREAPVGGNLVHLLVGEHLENRRKEVEPHTPRELLDALLLVP